MTLPEPRTAEQRRKDVLTHFEQDVDAWVSTAGAEGAPYLIPLSFLWDGAVFLVATRRSAVTSRNLLAGGGQVRLAFGPTRDVVLVQGVAEPADDLDAATCDAFAVKTGFDPREEDGTYQYFRIHPRRIQAWREVNELADRTLMRDGNWL